MKAKLILTVDDDDDGLNSFILLSIRIPKIKDIILHEIKLIDSKDDYFFVLEEIINEVPIWKNAIPGIELCIDNSVYTFLEQDFEEVEKFINKLILEM